MWTTLITNIAIPLATKLGGWLVEWAGKKISGHMADRAKDNATEKSDKKFALYRAIEKAKTDEERIALSSILDDIDRS